MEEPTLAYPPLRLLSTTVEDTGEDLIEATRVISTPHGNHLLHLVAPQDDIRPEKTGVHGQIDVMLDQRMIAYDSFNWSKQGQRGPFAGYVTKKRSFTDILPFYSREDFTQDIENFTYEAPKLKIKSQILFENMAGDPDIEVKQLIKNYVIEGGGTILNALPKQGKSYVALAMAVSADAGLSQLWETEQANCLYVNLERSKDSLKLRLAKVNEALGLPPRRTLPFINAKGLNLMQLMPSIQYQMRLHKTQIIFIDSISRAGMGSLLEDSTAMKLTDALNNLVKESSRAWVGIAHRSWTNEHVFGSVHFLGSCDAMVDVEASHLPSGNDMGVMLSVSGQNDMAPSDPQVVSLTFDNRGLTGMERAHIEDYPELEESQPQNTKEEVIRFIKAKGGTHLKVSQISVGTGIKRSTISNALLRNLKTSKKPDGLFETNEDGAYALATNKADDNPQETKQLPTTKPRIL